jgi:cell division protease FtsH
VIEEGHELALTVLREHMDDLHTLSRILIERETIDRDQFERLLSGASEEEVFPEEPEEPPVPPAIEEQKRKPEVRPRPFPLPGATMQPPPEGAKG